MTRILPAAKAGGCRATCVTTDANEICKVSGLNGLRIGLPRHALAPGREFMVTADREVCLPQVLQHMSKCVGTGSGAMEYAVRWVVGPALYLGSEGFGRGRDAGGINDIVACRARLQATELLQSM